MIFKTNNKIEKLKNCVCCGNDNLNLVLDLHDQPLANSYLKSNSDIEEIFPLQLNFCEKCTHLQLSHVVNPDYLFKNYLYVSGTSKTLKDYFDWFVNFTELFYTGIKNKTVLDIACNDGSQLNSYKKRGYNTYGIDPAINLYELSSSEHNVICDYLTEENIKSFGVTFDTIIAQNVFAHNDYPEQFLLYCKPYLKDDGHMFIQTSQADMVYNNEFDSIYHEHLSFFSVKSFCTLANRCGFNVVNVSRTPVHGTSFVFVLSKTGNNNAEYYISKERILTLDFLKNYNNICSVVVDNLNNAIIDFKLKGYKIVGYGAAAKGNTLLNFGKIKLDYIVDDNSYKHNLYTPGMKIAIYSPDKLKEETDKIVIIPLAWNFFDEIKEKVSVRINNAIFIKYFPTIKIEE
jgi:2-polyprenyl-3-methyl-5-hydroxy-6-metoxy-1,4-benzoquinol methylase